MLAFVSRTLILSEFSNNFGLIKKFVEFPIGLLLDFHALCHEVLQCVDFYIY
jgi:hypothetical protein